MFLLSLPQTNTWATWQKRIIYRPAYYSPFGTLVPLNTKMEVIIRMSNRPGERWPWQSDDEAKAVQEGHPSLKRLLPEQLPLLLLLVCSEYLLLFHAFHHNFFIPSIPFSMQNYPSHVRFIRCRSIKCRMPQNRFTGSRTTSKIPRLPDFGQSNPRSSGLLEAIGLGDLTSLCCRSWF